MAAPVPLPPLQIADSAHQFARGQIEAALNDNGLSSLGIGGVSIGGAASGAATAGAASAGAHPVASSSPVGMGGGFAIDQKSMLILGGAALAALIIMRR